MSINPKQTIGPEEDGRLATYEPGYDFIYLRAPHHGEPDGLIDYDLDSLEKNGFQWDPLSGVCGAQWSPAGASLACHLANQDCLEPERSTPGERMQAKVRLVAKQSEAKIRRAERLKRHEASRSVASLSKIRALDREALADEQAASRALRTDLILSMWARCSEQAPAARAHEGDAAAVMRGNRMPARAHQRELNRFDDCRLAWEKIARQPVHIQVHAIEGLLKREEGESGTFCHPDTAAIMGHPFLASNCKTALELNFNRYSEANRVPFADAAQHHACRSVYLNGRLGVSLYRGPVTAQMVRDFGMEFGIVEPNVLGNCDGPISLWGGSPWDLTPLPEAFACPSTTFTLNKSEEGWLEMFNRLAYWPVGVALTGEVSAG